MRLVHMSKNFCGGYFRRVFHKLDCTHKVKHRNYKLVASYTQQTAKICVAIFFWAFAEMLMKSTNLEWLGGFIFECTRHILLHTMNGIYTHFTIL